MTALSPLGMAALELSQEFGYALFPVHYPVDSGCSCASAECASVGKHPMTPNGLLAATTHPDAIAAWWDRTPAANIGVATGAASGVVVLDVDGPAGDAALAAFGTIPPTVTAITARGRHLLFAAPAGGLGNSAKRLGPELDVRGDGGYIVAPPSVHASGHRYAWAMGCSPYDRAPAAFPPAMLDQLREMPDRLATASRLPLDTPANDRERRQSLFAGATSLEDAVQRIDRRIRAYVATLGQHGQGSRNNAAFQLSAWLLRDMALPDPAAWAYLEAWNRGNTPPLHARELATAFHSAGRHGRRPVGFAHRDGGHVA